ncbi:DUF2946 domain-containing protein [Sphaerotilus sp.]|uniref:DUF2946 domain-containing protein n=1 Tax=Sphaerotilus sp. TaxID=2093942 RepID=UPI002ACEBBDD|nr:DUF2946 domain-containing protein [Sphaerotilus sp.]MDZ7855889.1 DUF2946 domain-containing protein [Sphaerotilus sp.]
MFSRRSTQAFTTWIVGIALLLAGLAPALSHALRAGDSPGWIEVCSAANGLRLRATGPVQDDPASKPVPGHVLEHCPYCSLRSAVLGMPPAPLVTVWAPMAVQAHPGRFLSAPRTPHVWVSAQPRAPPSFS